MKFIHLADCHIDGYREKKLADLGFENFQYVLNEAIKLQVNFILIAGDLFNTALPRVDALKDTTAALKKLQDKNIPVYIIPGSHDYSPNNKSMLDVLELAGLVINVAKIEDNNLKLTIDKRTSTQLTGIMGRAGMLDQQLYKTLNIKTPSKDAYSIFMFHTSIQELINNKNIPASSLSLLPPGFDYYAGGHIHIRSKVSTDSHKQVVYPGPTFPNSFSELEELHNGSYVVVDTENKTIEHKLIPTKKVISLHIIVDDKTALHAYEYIHSTIQNTEVKDTILLLRVVGTLSEGSIQDIDFRELFKLAYEKQAHLVLKNTHKLQSNVFEELGSIDPGDDIEEEMIKVQENPDKIYELLNKLNFEQYDGEKKAIFTERVIETAKKILEN